MNWIALGLLFAFCLLGTFAFPLKKNVSSGLADPRNCSPPKCDVEGVAGVAGVACKKQCSVNYSGYDITPLRTDGFNVTPLHDIWSDPDYLSNGWCANPHTTTDIEWVDPPVPDYRIRNPNFC